MLGTRQKESENVSKKQIGSDSWTDEQERLWTGDNC